MLNENIECYSSDDSTYHNGWHFDFYDNNAFLLGCNFNTNTHYGNEREYYICLYFGKWTFTVGKFHK